MFPKILIANRGEIAVRVIRACKEMGISTVAVFSEADRDALHVSLADESYCIGPAPAAKSYLNIPAILSAAQLSGAAAVHPGYGLLSENPDFAEACEKMGVKFIGPSADIIRKMGDKDEARRTMKAAKVPVVPGTDVLKDEKAAKKAADKIGYPVLIKARAGGGGRGIRLIERAEDLERAFLAAKSEAACAFSDGEVYMEKYLTNVKHIEVQILADQFGHVLSLGERECSMQRKSQKLIEESPSSAVDEPLRRKLEDAAVLAAKTVNYEGAGTVEFLLDSEKNFYFMEMNTRLQVEHPVTEMETGLDLVKWQIRVAAGAELPFKPGEIRPRGCAIECRINAENPHAGFRPSAGKVTLLHVPGGPWVRFDTALYQEYVIPPFYDSMVAKLIVHAHTRPEAIRKMQAALCEMVIEGIEHTGPMLCDLINEPAFVDGSYTTSFLKDKEF